MDSIGRGKRLRSEVPAEEIPEMDASSEPEQTLLHPQPETASYKRIWDEVGMDQIERERVLLELEQECHGIYRRKVDSANISRMHLHQELADSETELTNLLLSLGERSFPGRPERLTGSLKEQLDSITPALREMQLRKQERMKQFQEIQLKIQGILLEIAGGSECGIKVEVNENDLSLNKLEEYQNELHHLYKEKNERLERAEGYINVLHQLAAAMGMDSSKIIADIHPSLDSTRVEQTKNISNNILDRLNSTVEVLKSEERKRMDKLYRLGIALTNLWNLMNTPIKDRQQFTHMTVYISRSTCKITSPGSLTLDIIDKVESEVERLDQLKVSKMKEVFLQKQIELEEICKNTHTELPSEMESDNIMNLITSGEMDHADLIATMEQYISKARDEACSRKDIMEKVDKWMVSCAEEHWLEEYNKDESRYSVSRGAHRNLRRAERARLTTNKIPGLVELLITRTKIWEEERKKTFIYDEVPLLAMLTEYTLLRQEKEEEKFREKERKKGEVELSKDLDLCQSRPNTSSQQSSNRSLNCSFSSSTSLNQRFTSMTQQPASNTTIKEASFNKVGKKIQTQLMLGEARNYRVRVNRA